MNGFWTKLATSALLTFISTLVLNASRVRADETSWLSGSPTVPDSVARLPQPQTPDVGSGLSRATTASFRPAVFPGGISTSLASHNRVGPLTSAPYGDPLAPANEYVDYDAYVNASHGPPLKSHLVDSHVHASAEPWHWQILPAGLVYDSYLADTKASRLAAHIVNISPGGWTFDGILGARVGLLRYGTSDPIRPVGFQIDAEGAGQVRLDIPDDVDVNAVDFRAGVPITFGWGRHRTRVGYYHLSSHVGDEFMLKNPDFRRLNFARDVLYAGHAIYLTPKWRIYGEIGWAFYTDVSEPWELRFGVEYAPCGPTGIYGEPFFAAHGHLREEVDFGGSLSIQTGWAWRGDTGGMLRAGLMYYNGKSNQFSFFFESEEQIGFGLWYDF